MHLAPDKLVDRMGKGGCSQGAFPSKLTLFLHTTLALLHLSILTRNHITWLVFPSLVNLAAFCSSF